MHMPTPDGKPMVLLVPHTLGTHAVEHFEALVNNDYDVDIKTRNLGGPYDLIVQMGLGPGGDMLGGLDRVEQLSKELPGTPILVVSGHDPSYARPEVLERGAVDFLQKDEPREMEEFLKRVDTILKSKAAPSQ